MKIKKAILLALLAAAMLFSACTPKAISMFDYITPKFSGSNGEGTVKIDPNEFLKFQQAVYKQYIPEKDLNRYDRIGFASGIYYSKFHQAVLNFAAVNMPQNKQTFFISTYGGKADYTSIEKALTAKNSVLLGKYGCKGYDTFGPFKLMGGLAKGHPDEGGYCRCSGIL